jgi:DNA-binding response OmpR family regulator
LAYKLLIVDDEENQRRLYAQEFEDEGYTVIEAADGRSAVEKMRAESPDLVVLDICMPGMDGIEALGKMLGADVRVPVVLNTAYSAYKDNFMSWAADAYVVKSADLSELKSTVRGLLEARGGV